MVRTAPLQESIGYALRRAQGAVYSTLNDALARISLRPLEFTLLMMVAENPGASQSGVCDALGIQKANCVPTMSELERRGLIIRRRSTSDARLYELHITNKGKRILQRAGEVSRHTNKGSSTALALKVANNSCAFSVAHRLQMNPIVQSQRHGDIVVIVVDNPPVNTITAAARAAMREALETLSADKSVRAVVLRCAGNNFFTGADINEFSGPPKEAEYRALWAQFEGLKVPMIAAMHGSSIGGGLELALACHYRIAPPTAKFMLPEVTLGIIPGAGGTQRLPRLIGLDNALRMILDAKPVDAGSARDGPHR